MYTEGTDSPAQPESEIGALRALGRDTVNDRTQRGNGNLVDVVLCSGWPYLTAPRRIFAARRVRAARALVYLLIMKDDWLFLI